MTDYLPILLALLFVAVVFIVAASRGVVPMLSSGLALVGGVVTMTLGVYLIPAVSSAIGEEGLSWKLIIGASLGLGFVVAVILRLIFGWFFNRLFGGDSQYSWMTDGLFGGFLSLIPSLAGVMLMFTGFRVAGTVLELNYTASLARQGIVDMAGKIPPYPGVARLRNTIESFPVLPDVLDLMDPFSHRVHRNTAALVIIGDVGPLSSYLLQQPETAEFAGNDIFDEHSSDPEIRAVLKNHDWAGLVLHPKIRQTVLNSELNGALRKLKLQRSLEGFVESLGPGNWR